MTIFKINHIHCGKKTDKLFKEENLPPEFSYLYGISMYEENSKHLGAVS